MNLRPPGYEPDELPDCSTPRPIVEGPDHRLSPAAGIAPATTYFRNFSHYHRRAGLNCRVRNGNGCDPYAMVTGKFLRRRAWADNPPENGNNMIVVKPVG